MSADDHAAAFWVSAYLSVTLRLAMPPVSDVPELSKDRLNPGPALIKALFMAEAKLPIGGKAELTP